MNENEDPINWPLEQKVDEFIEIVFGGKHHLRNFEMKHNHAVVVPYGPMATVDMNYLTTAVFASHQLGLRVDIENHGIRGIRLLCHSRSVREGCLTKRHPTIIEALKQYGMEVITKAEHDAAIAKLQKENEKLRNEVALNEHIRNEFAKVVPDLTSKTWEDMFERVRDLVHRNEPWTRKGGTNGD